MINLPSTDDIQAEADRILDSGLSALLAEYGEVHLVGSYALRLMTWRDLDIHIVQEAADIDRFFGLGGRIASLLHPHRMHFRDESLARTPDLPQGFYTAGYRWPSVTSGRRRSPSPAARRTPASAAS